MFVYLNGKIVSKKDANISVCDNGFLYGDAIFETMRTVNGKLWLLNEHLKRLRQSARILGIRVPLTNAQLTNLISRLQKKNGHKESRIRITISRGCNGFDFTTCKKPTFLIEVNKLKLPPRKIYIEGVSAITYKIERPIPEFKSNSMLPSIMAIREAKKKKAFEAFMIDRNGNVTEGSTSNVFIVKKGKIITPKDGILKGTVRNFIMKKTATKEVNISLKKLHGADEVFLTSSIKSAVPVVKIDGKKIGTGKVGPVTKSIINLLKECR
ncbi:aminotransferase class IV [Patescibacteria group bacterium]